LPAVYQQYSYSAHYITSPSIFQYNHPLEEDAPPKYEDLLNRNITVINQNENPTDTNQNNIRSPSNNNSNYNSNLDINNNEYEEIVTEDSINTFVDSESND
jgi:hypothetical protein